MTNDSPTITWSCRAVLCDMDGTLVDSTAVVEATWSDFAQKYDVDLDELLAHAHGRLARHIVERYAPADSDVDELTAHQEAQEQSRTDGVIEVPGAARFLAGVPEDAIAIVTSATDALMRIRMDAAGLPVVGTLVTADDVPKGKPDPAPYLRAAELLGVSPADAVVFEDSDAGVRAALAAGMRTVVVGSHRNSITKGLPRVRDFNDVAIDLADGDSGTLRLTLRCV